jgi:glutathione synthase
MRRNSHTVLILTDHTNHSANNSLYDISIKLLSHPLTESVDIASRAVKQNDDFFDCNTSATIWATPIKPTFHYHAVRHPLSFDYREVDTSTYDLIWLRLPPPLEKEFLDFLSKKFANQFIINNPDGIFRTGSKEFLMKFEHLCPSMKICRSLDDIVEFRNRFPIVLKPFSEYGGKGIIRIDDNTVWMNNDKSSFEDFRKEMQSKEVEYLAVKYLKNVFQGDKRIVVVNGEILGASLRLPAKDSWICNVSMGGTSVHAEVTEDELNIVNEINPVLSEMGIVMYGLDTLVDDNDKRVLSEINTTSIGGLSQIARFRNQPIIERTIDLIWAYYEKQMK